MRIGLDSDGVIYRFSLAYNAKLIELGHYVDLEGEPNTWDYFKSYGYTTEEFLTHLDELVDQRKIYCEGQLYEKDIPWLIAELRRAGNTIHIVTNRFSGKSYSAQEATAYFFKKVGIEYDSLTFAKDKTIVKTDVFLEDHTKNYDDLTAAGVETFLVDRPYNQDGPGEYRKRVGSFYEFAEKMLLRGYNEQMLKKRSLGFPDRNFLRS